ncbi:hypothetical protein K2173_012096 [Erythroxylum novogranatense]|uniref:Reverse transcriptase domain-containing protein n=1 Tax=Erythroxylum novogranatense TaxID=1862640 RepID=A0AAV8TGN1_9ROSI|nr:hypothetical protein K2173_012096 [Erythroxylum novogranatense]
MTTSSEEDTLVAEMYQRLNIEENEGTLEYEDEPGRIEQQYTESERQHCVIGRLLTEKIINFPIFKQIIASIWRPVKGMMIKDLGNNVFIFQFFHHLDMDRVLRDGPWNYQQQILLLRRLQPMENPRQVELVRLELWVQIHNIPSGFITEKLVVDAGNYIGEYLESDSRNFSSIWRDFMRIRVVMDIRQPLKRKLFVKRPQGEKICLDFKYERLNTFCYFCGIVGHTDRFCRLLYEHPKIPREKFAYGVWLKAETRKTTQIDARWLRSELNISEEIKEDSTEFPAIATHNPRRRIQDDKIQDKGDMEEDQAHNTSEVGPKNLSLLGFAGMFTVDPVGNKGGLALLWRIEDTAQLLSYSQHHVDIVVVMEGIKRWRLTGFYGYPERHSRHLGWNLIRRLHTQSTLPWCVIGDFNDIMFPYEKHGTHSHPRALMEGFRQTLSSCSLYDLGADGSLFTWENRRNESALVRERLDRAVATTAWSSSFWMARVSTLQTESSDHLPIFLSLGVQLKKYVSKRFIFENAWAMEEECRQRIKWGWLTGSLVSIQDRLRNCSRDLQIWANSKKEGFQLKIAQLKQQMASLRMHNTLDLGALKAIERQYGALLLQHELYWKQRLKQHWLTVGDSNSKFFHLMASHRHRKNFISKLKNNRGEWIDWDSGLPNMILEYFQHLFTSSCGDTAPILNNVKRKVTSLQNEMLIAPYTTEEIKTAIFSMHPDKSPGPDGFNPGFFQTYWDLIGKDVTQACLCTLNDGDPLPGLNRTNPILIPKKQTSETIADLRPISLSNVIDRIICKTIANRLKQILPHIISETQSAFIPNRLITDNIIVAYELFHSIKRKTQGKVGSLALKTDMSKAYDRIEWEYLHQIMLKLGFHESWVSRIMNIVTSVNYYFVRGNEEYGPLIPNRGLRQGDPLSPYLFIICAEGLSASLQQEQARGNIHGTIVARGAPPVSHLFFADDAIFFVRATVEETNILKTILHLYEQASGQKINLDKSGISFTPNTAPLMKDLICHTLGVKETLEPSNYLGMPSVVGRGKRQVFHYVTEKLTKRIQAQTMPNYLMSLFLLLISTCQELETLMNGFFWHNGGRDNKGIRWMQWKKLAIPKKFKGLGYRELRHFNLALLAKQGWRILKFPNSIVSSILKARYFPYTDFISADLGNNPSQIWRSIHQAKAILLRGCRRRVGNGQSVQIWRDPWLMDGSDPFVQSECTVEVNYVSDLMEGHRWNESKIRRIFTQRDAELIFQIPLSLSSKQDDWLWTHNNQGEYRVKEGYRLAMEEVNVEFRDTGFPWEKIWQLHIPGKVKLFLWRLLRKTIPCKAILKERHVDLRDTCSLCDNSPETEDHLFLHCDFARSVWSLISVNWSLSCTATLHQWLTSVMLGGSKTQQEEYCIILWSLWIYRNEVVWQQKRKDPSSILHRASTVLSEWKHAQHRHQNSSTRTQLPHPSMWKAPALHHYKCNIDVALLSSGSYGLGMIIRDSNGLNCAGKLLTLPGWRDPQIDEALCFREALSWIKCFAYEPICVETDCQIVTQFLSSVHQFPSYLSLIIDNCKALLQEHRFISTAFVKRSANQVAHKIARATNSMSDFEWGVCPPYFLYDVLSLDVNNMR